MKEKILPRYYLLDFCNGELTIQESFESSTLLDIYLISHFVEDPFIVYGYDLTNYFCKK